jgi:hypothetical protein
MSTCQLTFRMITRLTPDQAFAEAKRIYAAVESGAISRPEANANFWALAALMNMKPEVLVAQLSNPHKEHPQRSFKRMEL